MGGGQSGSDVDPGEDLRSRRRRKVEVTAFSHLKRCHRQR